MTSENHMFRLRACFVVLLCFVMLGFLGVFLRVFLSFSLLYGIDLIDKNKNLPKVFVIMPVWDWWPLLRKDVILKIYVFLAFCWKLREKRQISRAGNVLCHNRKYSFLYLFSLWQWEEVCGGRGVFCKIPLKSAARSEDGIVICCLPAFCSLYILSPNLY